ncbi:MAG: HAD-IIIA family hydrolase [Campylobacterales bacterium]|nr:HAD-IIIA family hydrolase [Campylobacterales bacterium]
MIELIVLDVDGTLTDGGIIYGSDGVESKKFNVKDGLAIATWKKMGRKVAIITGRESNIVERRANELKIDFLVQKCKTKEAKIKELAESLDITLSSVAAIGDDLNDLGMLKAVGDSYCPKDSNEMIKPYVKNVLEEKGGEGAVAAMIKQIIKEENKEEEFISQWL